MRSRKYRVVTTLERVNNRLTRAALRRGFGPRWYALLETTGRRSGRPRHTPVGAGMRRGDDVFWLIAAHGDQADYVRNIEASPRVRVKWRNRWYAGVATILRDDDTDARSRTLPVKWDAAFGRLIATTPLTIRIDLTGSGTWGSTA
jgi:deazaflavin-dependent oxidoreductase (nitroreductase family)